MIESAAKAGPAITAGATATAALKAAIRQMEETVGESTSQRGTIRRHRRQDKFRFNVNSKSRCWQSRIIRNSKDRQRKRRSDHAEWPLVIVMSRFTTILIFKYPPIPPGTFDFNLPLVTCCGTKAIAVEMRQRKAAMVFMVAMNSTQRVRTGVDKCVSDAAMEGR